ncbi:MAG TPA: hypothetical protein VKB96_01450 [Gammaproteobacteria bacterium]|nr:hypothetical protein [Gammaproteobacteria bacterium]
MSIDSKRYFTRHPASCMVCSAFVLFICQISLPVASYGAQPSQVVDPSLGRFDRVFLRQAAFTPPRPISFGQTISGTLTSTDYILPDGTPIDGYTVVTQTPNQTYVITASSPDVPLRAAIGFVQSPTYSQAAEVGGLAGQVQFSGTLPQVGQYLIVASSLDQQRPVGSYRLSLTHKPVACPPATAP